MEVYQVDKVGKVLMHEGFPPGNADPFENVPPFIEKGIQLGE
jgi:hypothetical protein